MTRKLEKIQGGLQEGPHNQGRGKDGGGDDGTDSRLRAVEKSIGEIETHLKYMPTKEDLESVKTLIAEKEAMNTRWMIGIISTALLSVVIVLIRTFTN